MSAGLTAAVVVAAGKSTRMGGGKNKVLTLVREKPILAFCLETFQQCESVSLVVIVSREENHKEVRAVVDRYCPKADGHFVIGGAERFDSVKYGLEYLAAFSPDAVLIHDAARPFLEIRFIGDSLSALKEFPGAVIGVPLKDTLKETDGSGCVKFTHPREQFWLAQTPQTFRYKEILQAYRACTPPPYPTDDAAVLEMSGGTVKMVEGSYRNFKITTPEDLILAQALWDNNP